VWGDDLKTERRTNHLHEKFALTSQLGNSFISNCQKAFTFQYNTTVDEQLLGFKFQLVVDVGNKYLFNSFFTW